MPEERVHKIVVPTVTRAWCGTKMVSVDAANLGRWECCEGALEHLLLIDRRGVSINVASTLGGFDRTLISYCPWCGVKFELVDGKKRFMKYVRRLGDVGDWVDYKEHELENGLKGES